MTVRTLYPNLPGARTIAEGREWWVNTPQGRERVSAEHNTEDDAITVFVGTTMLPLDYVSPSVTVWECIADMVEEWQADTLERDHTEALAENEVLSTVPRYIGYAHVAFGGFDVMGFSSIRAAREFMADDSQWANMSLYACVFDVDMWRDALDMRDVGNPFDYPDYVLSRGPRGGIIVERA